MEKTILHTEKVINEWWLREVQLEDIAPIIISVNDGDSSSDESECESD